MSNQCTNCNTSFEPEGDHWILCPGCQKSRRTETSQDLERLLSRFQDDPDCQEMKPQVTAARSRLLGDLY